MKTIIKATAPIIKEYLERGITDLDEHGVYCFTSDNQCYKMIHPRVLEKEIENSLMMKLKGLGLL